MDALSSGGLGVAIGDGAAADMAAMQEGLAAEEPVPEMGTVMMNNREVQEGADGRMYYVDDNTPAEGISMGMYRGGSVQAFNKGGQAKKRGYDYGNAARTFGQGLTFGTADEIEAFIRAKAGGRPYKTERDEIRRLQERYALANPNTALALEGAGMIGGSMLAPSLGATRMVANAPRLARFGAGAVDDLAQGAAYAAGQAKTMRDIPRTIREEAPINAAFYGGMSGAGAAGRLAAKTKAGKAAIDVASKPVRYAAKKIRK
jgi:hypothetical protein